MRISPSFKLIGFLVLCCSANLAVCSEPQKITFEEALQITLQNNFQMKQADHHLLQMEQEMKAAWGLHLPKVSLNAGYNLLEDRIHFDLTPVQNALIPLYQTLGTYGVFNGVPNPDPATKGLMPVLPDNISTQAVRQKMLEGLNQVKSAEWDLTIQEKQFGTVSAGLIWPVFTGGKINAANKAAKINYESVGLENIQKSYELTNELVERYFGLVLANQASKVRKDVQATMEKHYSDAKKLQEQGQIAQVELLNSKLNLADSEREYQKSVRQNEILNEALLNTLAEKDINLMQPVSSLFYLDSIEDLDYFYRLALQKSPLLAQVTKKKELAEEGLLAEKSGIFPNIALTGMYDIANKDLSPFLPSYMVGVGLKWNLFEGQSQSRRIKAKSYQKMQAEDYYQKASSDIHSAINKYYQELGMYREQLKMLNTSVELAEEYFRVRNKAFSQGMATSAQVSDASLFLAKSRIDRLQAMYGYDVSLSKLLYYAGLTDQFTEYMKRAEMIAVQQN
jgi:outer membrane protein TolC